MTPPPKPKQVKAEIFKVQKPLAGAPLMLIYNQSRSITFQFPKNKCGSILQLMRGRPKIYVEAAVINGIFEIDGVVEDQEW